MRKIVCGHLYDTETAEEIHPWTNGRRRDNFAWCRETLYRTKKGAFFIFGEGGPLSGYTEPAGDGMFGGSSDIRPLTENEAIEWLEAHRGTEALLGVFPGKFPEA